METEQLQRSVTGYVLSCGACAVGYAGLSGVPQAQWLHKPVGVCFLMPYPREAIMQLPDDRPFEAACEILRETTKTIIAGVCHLITGAGYEASAITSDMPAETLPDMTSPLPMKIVATMAGLGWIGKSGILVTESHRAGVRIAAIATSAPFKIARPITESHCGKCAACVKACPSQAIRNINWRQGMTRGEIIDIDRCYQYMARDMASIGYKHACGLCMKACTASLTASGGARSPV